MAITKLIPILVLPLCAHMGGSCGPSNEEAARAVLFAAPFALLAGAGLLRFLLWLWRKRRPELDMKWKPSLVGLAVLGAGLVLSFLGIREGVNPFEWYPAALLGMGTSYLAVLLLTWRIWLWIHPRTAFTWSFLVPVVAMFWPCPILLLAGSPAWGDLMVVVWIIPGYVGAVPGGMLAVLVGESLIRIRMAKRESTA